MSDGKIHIPARRKQPVDDQMVVKVTPEAYNALVEIYNESTLSLKQIASLLIVNKIYDGRIFCKRLGQSPGRTAVYCRSLGRNRRR